MKKLSLLLMLLKFLSGVFIVGHKKVVFFVFVIELTHHRGSKPVRWVSIRGPGITEISTGIK